MGFRRADTGRGWRSSSSVGGGNFSGRMRWRKDTGSWVSDAIHRSDTTWTQDESYKLSMLPLTPLLSHLDEVLRGEGLKDRNKEVDDMFICAVLALEEEVLVMEDDLTVHVFHKDPERLANRKKEQTLAHFKYGHSQHRQNTRLRCRAKNQQIDRAVIQTSWIFLDSKLNDTNCALWTVFSLKCVVSSTYMACALDRTKAASA